MMYSMLHQESSANVRFKHYAERENSLASSIKDLSTLDFLVEKMSNICKLRIRKILSWCLNSNPKDVALHYLNFVLKAGLRNYDLDSCCYTTPWVGDGKDIVVTFKNKDIRKNVYALRTVVNGGLFEVCDELGPERICIWKILLEEFGETNVYTKDGAVVVSRIDGTQKFLHLASAEEYVLTHGLTMTDTALQERIIAN